MTQTYLMLLKLQSKYSGGYNFFSSDYWEISNMHSPLNSNILTLL